MQTLPFRHFNQYTVVCCTAELQVPATQPHCVLAVVVNPELYVVTIGTAEIRWSGLSHLFV
jgi:hypothetical protein